MRVLVPLLLLLGSCDGPAITELDAGPPEDGGSPRLEVGTGESTFVALNDGDPVELVHGPQGGYHVLVAVRATSLAATVGYAYEVRDEADAVVLTMPGAYVLDASRVVRTSTGWIRSGDRGIFQTVMPAEIIGRTLHLHATVTASDGTSYTDTHTIHVVDLVP